jgi:hypothetical protein
MCFELKKRSPTSRAIQGAATRQIHQRRARAAIRNVRQPRSKLTGISSNKPNTNISDVTPMAKRWLPPLSQVISP